MSYQVLARKLRPAHFSDLVGQDHVVQALSHGLDQDRLHHAYLFTGTRGVGKTTIARILARSLNCETGVSSKPCGVCGICQEVLQNRFIDLIELDAASRTGVDDTRELIENAQYLPSRGRYKVYLIDEVHMLSKAAFNALLKTLEEPPAHVKFLLATTDPKKVPVTVLSRCLQFQLKNLSASAIVDYLTVVLQREAISFEADALTQVAQSARGSMRDALSLVDQAVAYGSGAITGAGVTQMLGTAGRNEVEALIAAIAVGDAAALLALIGELAERSVDFADLLAALIAQLHRFAVQHALGEAGVESKPPFDAETVQLHYQIALLGLRDLQVVPDPQMGFEMTVLRMLAFAPLPLALDVAESGTDSGGAGGGTERGVANATGDREGQGAVASNQPNTTSAVDAAPVQVPALLAAQWYELVPSLNLTGVGKLLVEHALPLTNQPTDFHLVLDADHDMLLSDTQVRVVERALAERLATSVRLRISAAPLQQETPAARSVRLRAARLRAAELAIASDPTVQQLLQEFGGQVQLVKPLDE